MNNDQRHVASFVIRFTQHTWKDQQGEPRLQWRGQIRHVQDDQQISFTDLEEALSFMRQHLTQLTLEAAAGESHSGQESLLRESFKLWEGLVSSYTDMMKATIERTFGQSEVLKGEVEGAVERALQSWDVTAGADTLKVTAALDRLNAQIHTLVGKIQQLEDVLEGDA